MRIPLGQASAIVLVLGLFGACRCGEPAVTDQTKGCDVDADCPAGNACFGRVCVPKDTDQDGVGDTTDDCPTVANAGQEDQDHDGLGDACDPDQDGDGVPNATDDCPQVANADQSDVDHDGIGDACDPDIDGDGVPNASDDCPAVANPSQADEDHDGLGDACDDDRDGDGVPNATDNCPDVANANQSDVDGDGVGDLCDSLNDDDHDGVPNASDDCPEVANADQADEDQDGVGDACDDDRDGDGVPNATDNCPDVANADQSDVDGDGVGDLCDSLNDDDHDGVPNASDDCPEVANANQADEDHDGLGDACDDNRDGDGVPNATDNCPDVANADQSDRDHDGAGDACDPDLDGDGVPNGVDNCPTVSNPEQKDDDQDGLGNSCDNDKDGDGVANGSDNCVSVPNSDQADGDGDGVGDACDDSGVRSGGPVNAACKLKIRKPFNTSLEWRWPDSTVFPTIPDAVRLDKYGVARTQVMVTPVVGDVNADGVTDVVFTAFTINAGVLQPGALVMADGRTGRTEWMVSPTGNTISPAANLAIANLDNSADHSMEIVTLRYNAPGGLEVFHSDGSLEWSCTQTSNCRDYLHNGQSWGGPAIADLDGDGVPEIVYGATAYARNADGSYRILWDRSGDHLGAGDNGVGPLSVVAELDGDPSNGPEVVTGRTAYHGKDGSTFWDHPADPDGFVALGNFDEDPAPEIVVVSDNHIRLLDTDGSLLWGPNELPAPAGVTGRRGGAPTVADFDGDGFPEVGVATNGMYAVWDTDGSLLWETVTQDYSSAATGSSVFDFEGDGWAEVVYNDEQKLRVYDGATGDVLFEAPNSTATAYEYPVIADDDGDGHAEIIVGSNPYGTTQTTGVSSYGDDADWVATRSIWNEHGYHVTNVDEDGTVPAHEVASWAPGTFDGWSIGDNGGSFRDNASEPPTGFYQAAPDLAVVDTHVDLRQCPASATVRFWLENRGGADVPQGTQVAVFRGQTTDPSALLATVATHEVLHPGDAEEFSVPVTDLHGGDEVTIIADPTGTLTECGSKTNNDLVLVGGGCP